MILGCDLDNCRSVGSLLGECLHNFDLLQDYMVDYVFGNGAWIDILAGVLEFHTHWVL